MKKHILVICIFDDASSAVDVIHELRRSGFSDDQLGFAVRYAMNEHGANILAEEIMNGLLGGTAMLRSLVSETDIYMEQREAATSAGAERQQEKHGAGSIIGGVIGGTLGTVAVLRLPAIGLIVAGGSLAAILADAAPGRVVDNFLSIDIPVQKARYYEQKFQIGSIIFTIKANEQQQEAQDILRYHRAHSIEVH